MSKPSRRSVLRAGVLAAAVPLGLAGAATSAVAGMGGTLRRSTFLPLVGKKVTLTAAGRSWRATLTEVNDLPGARPASESSFVLAFRADRPVEQGTYRVQHGAYGGLDLFVTPVGRRPGVLEAIVNTR